MFSEPDPVPGQDPWLVPFEGGLLLVQSSDDDRRIVIRRCRDLDRLDGGEEVVVWDPRGLGDHAEQLWAPELHHLGPDAWYLYVAASDGANRNHRSYVLEADHPLGPYRERGKLADATDRWSIDLTVLDLDGRLHAVWSGWEGDGRHGDEPQHLYMAAMANPWTLTGPRVRISSPDLPWERSVAPINEGPQVLRRPDSADGDGLFLVYSADASWTHAYKLGVLEWVGGSALDVLDPSCWRKLDEPLLTGGGHGCFVDTPAGIELVHHRKTVAEDGWGDRVIARAPVGWDTDGRPVIRGRGPGRRAEPVPSLV